MAKSMRIGLCLFFVFIISHWAPLVKTYPCATFDYNNPLLYWEDMNYKFSEDGHMSLNVTINFNPIFCLAHSEKICKLRLSPFHNDQTLFDITMSIPTEDTLYFVVKVPIASAQVGERLRVELSSTNSDYIYDVWRPLILSKNNSSSGRFTNSQYERKVVYIHPPKTGGYSVARSLRDSLALSPDVSHVWQLSHFSIDQMIKLLPEFNPNNYLIVVTVRNPYDRLYSIYRFHKHHKMQRTGEAYPGESTSVSFEDYVMNWFLKMFEGQVPLQITDWMRGASVVVPIRFENYEEDFRNFCTNYGFENLLLHLNANPYYRNDYYGSVPHYTPEMRKLVESVFKEDLKLFNYSYISFVEDWVQKYLTEIGNNLLQ